MSRSSELTSAMSRLIATQPFFAVLLMDLLTVKETTSLPTAATDGKNLFINPEFFANDLKNSDERVFVLAHEVLHVVMSHCPRLKLYMDRGFGPDLKAFSANRWNRATDYIINHSLHEAGVGKLPQMALYNPNFTCEMLADDVYCELDEDDSEDSLDQHLPSASSDVDAQQGKIQRAVAAAVQAAEAAKQTGNIPGHLKRMVQELLEPQISWHEKLRISISRNAGKDEATWSRPNRRRMAMPPHLYWPGTTGYQAGHIVVYIDTSGSISEGELQHFLSEAAGVLDDTKPELMHIGSCDSEAYDPVEILDVQDVVEYQPEGGGGTHMPAIYDTLDKNDMVPDTLVILTDGYTGWDTAPPYPVIIVSTTDQEAPYGETIRLTVN